MRTLREKHATEISDAEDLLVESLRSVSLRASRFTVKRLWQRLGHPEDLRAFLDAVARIETAWLDRALWEKVDADRRRWLDAPGEEPLNHEWFLKRVARLALLEKEGADVDRLRAALEGTASPANASKALAADFPGECCDGPGDGLPCGEADRAERVFEALLERNRSAATGPISDST